MSNHASRKVLIEQAELLVQMGKYQKALDHYNRLLETGPPHPYFFKRRAFIHSLLGHWAHAIEDARRAIDLNPDDAEIYINIGVYMTWELFSLKEVMIYQHIPVWEQVIRYYKEGLERNPTHNSGWLNLAETYLFLRRWDGAIAYYGCCKPYMDSKKHRLTRSWIGSLAIVLSGDVVEEEDFQPLNDSGIRLPKDSHDCRQVEQLLRELIGEGFSKERLTKAVDIHRKFLDHFDGPPKSFDYDDIL